MSEFIVKEHSNLDFSKMTPEELDAFIQREEKRCAEMTGWSEAWQEIVEQR